MIDTNELALEVSKLRGEVQARMDRLDGKIEKLEASLIGSAEARRREVDGQVTMLTDATRRMATSHAVADSNHRELTKDVQKLAEAVRAEREERLALASEYAKYVHGQVAAREGVERYVKRVTATFGFVSILLTIVVAWQTVAS